MEPKTYVAPVGQAYLRYRPVWTCDPGTVVIGTTTPVASAVGREKDDNDESKYSNLQQAKKKKKTVSSPLSMPHRRWDVALWKWSCDPATYSRGEFPGKMERKPQCEGQGEVDWTLVKVVFLLSPSCGRAVVHGTRFCLR